MSGILEGAGEALDIMEKIGQHYELGVNLALFRVAMAGSRFFIPADGVKDLDWAKAMAVARDNPSATGVSITFKDNGGIDVRML